MHVDFGETSTASVVREIAEELRVRLDRVALEPSGTMIRLSLEPRVDLFFFARGWDGTAPHRLTLTEGVVVLGAW